MVDEVLVCLDVMTGIARLSGGQIHVARAGSPHRRGFRGYAPTGPWHGRS